MGKVCEKNMKTLNEMRQLVQNKEVKVLTDFWASELKGKKIQTIYFGYQHQDHTEEFVVGEVKHEIYGNGKQGELCIFTEDGINTYIRLHKNEPYGKEGIFTCSDSDRIVYFIESEN